MATLTICDKCKKPIYKSSGEHIYKLSIKSDAPVTRNPRDPELKRQITADICASCAEEIVKLIKK